MCGHADVTGAFVPFRGIDKDNVRTVCMEGIKTLIIPQVNLDMFQRAYEEARAAWHDLPGDLIILPAATVFDALPLIFKEAQGKTFPIRV